jgi:hypothetical protein
VASSSDSCDPRRIDVQSVKVYLQVQMERGLSGWWTNGSGHNVHWVRFISLPRPLAHHPFSLISVHTYITHIILNGHPSWTTRTWSLRQYDPSKQGKYSPSAQHHITEELNLQKHHCENPLSHYKIPLWMAEFYSHLIAFITKALFFAHFETMYICVLFQQPFIRYRSCTVIVWVWRNVLWISSQ